MVRCVFGRSSGNLVQKIIIKPSTQKPTNAVAPKISKNRLLGDFCFSLSLGNI